MVYRKEWYVRAGWFIKKNGLKSSLIHREEWFIDKDGLQRRMVYREGWYIEENVL